MQKKCTKKLLSWILCMVLIVAMALCTAGCNGRAENGDAAADGQGADVRVESTEPGGNSESENASEAGNDSESGESVGSTEDGAQSEASVLGEGSTEFALTVVDKDGNETLFEIHTDKETVGEALLELELISGDESEYGFYVKTVNGITADYDTDSVETMNYAAGVYSSSVMLGDYYVDVQVIVDENRIDSISLVNLDDSVETMYPLMRPAFDEISEKVISKQTTEGITYDVDNQYISMVLLNAVENALMKARIAKGERVYWAFYINGEYAMTGVDATPITEGDSYSFKVE